MMKPTAIATWAGVGLLGITLTACDSSKSSAGADTAGPAATAKTSQAGEQAGTKHDPPIAKADVPDGHWYCDMGTVHYSRAAKGDGKCPLCHMDLKQK